jgi:hypothetical protein
MWFLVIIIFKTHWKKTQTLTEIFQTALPYQLHNVGFNTLFANIITNYSSIEFGVFTSVVMKSSVFWDITLCSPLKGNGCFWGTCPFNLQGWRISQAWNQFHKIELFSCSSIQLHLQHLGLCRELIPHRIFRFLCRTILSLIPRFKH